MDDVLEDFLGAWLRELNIKYGTKVTKKQVTGWDITDLFPGAQAKDLFTPLNNDEFWRSLVIKPKAQYNLKRLIDDGHEIYIVTATYFKSVPVKAEWILANFPFLKWEQIIICSRKQLIKGDVLVDDAPHNLSGGDYKKILFYAPHNRFFDETTIGAIRVSNWDEVYDEITAMAEE